MEASPSSEAAAPAPASEPPSEGVSVSETPDWSDSLEGSAAEEAASSPFAAEAEPASAEGCEASSPDDASASVSAIGAVSSLWPWLAASAYCTPRASIMVTASRAANPADTQRLHNGVRETESVAPDAPPASDAAPILPLRLHPSFILTPFLLPIQRRCGDQAIVFA